MQQSLASILIYLVQCLLCLLPQAGEVHGATDTGATTPRGHPSHVGIPCSPTQNKPHGCHCDYMERLERMNWSQLLQLYSSAKPGEIPCGYNKGKVLIIRTGPFPKIATKCAQLFWRGKHIDCCTNTSINQWPFHKSLIAMVYYGESFVDNGHALIIDYTQTSWRWRNVRDEVREVAPGIYLGAYFVRKHGCWRQKLFFVMQAPGDQ